MKLFLCSFTVISSLLHFVESSTDDVIGTSLIKNVLITPTDISELATISSTVRRMYEACNQGSYQSAYFLYQSSHSSKYSLQEIATNEKYQNVGLLHAFQMYGLTEGRFEQYTDKTPYTNFADEYIKSQMDGIFNGDTVSDDAEVRCKKATAASVWQVLFMQAQHELWGGMKDCQISGDPNYNNEAAGIPDHNAKADEFLAYWVGSLNDSLETKSDDSLFSSTNKIAKFFGTLKHGVAHANLNIIDGYYGLNALLSDDDSCSVGKATRTLKAMWRLNNLITPQMMVPLIQHLIKSILVDEDSDMIEVYANLVVPQMAQCRHSSYTYLRSTLLDAPFDTKNTHGIMKALQDSYGCFGITCEDIGVPSEYTSNTLLSCKDYDYSRPSFAGYYATTDVREEAKIDLDLHQMNILMSFDNDHYWSLADRIYMSGKNSIKDKANANDDSLDSVEYTSIHSIAKSALRKGTLFYDEMEEYNSNDPYFADNLVRDILKGDIYTNEPRSTRASIVYNTILTHVIYFYVLGLMSDATNKCTNESDSNSFQRSRNMEATKAWDRVAALIVGSLEDSKVGGSDDYTDGVSLWNLANKRGSEFSRLNDDGFAVVNQQVQNYLLSGKGQIQHQSCIYLSRTSKNIAHMLLIPMFQTMIKYALTNQFNDWKSDVVDVEVYLGENYAKFMIPVYMKYGQNEGARTVQKNMIRNLGPLVVDGPQKVADTYLKLAHHLGIQCEYIGKSFEVDGCYNYEPSRKKETSDGSQRPIIVGFTLVSSLFTLYQFF